jgi:hypothetical protein
MGQFFGVIERVRLRFVTLAMPPSGNDHLNFGADLRSIFPLFVLMKKYSFGLLHFA